MVWIARYQGGFVLKTGLFPVRTVFPRQPLLRAMLAGDDATLPFTDALDFVHLKRLVLPPGR